MAFKVFLSYSLDPTEQALAWRLQTLAAAHGIEMFVPAHGLTHPIHAGHSAEAIQTAIVQSDCVLAIITARADAKVIEELRYAVANRKLVIPIVRAELANHPWIAQFPKTFIFSAGYSPGKVEDEIVHFLNQQKVSKDKQQAIAGLAALGIGLLLLFSLSEK